MPGRKLNASQSFILLPATIITTAVAAGVGQVFADLAAMESLLIECVFTYGSGGTNATVYVQTSLTQGATWMDIMAFQFTTATARRVQGVRMGSALAANITPADGALTINTILDGTLGDRLRCKYVTTGTYGTNTTLSVFGVSKG